MRSPALSLSFGQNEVPPIDFERFRRNKEQQRAASKDAQEREQQGAPVYDTRSARSGVLESLRAATPSRAYLERAVWSFEVW